MNTVPQADVYLFNYNIKYWLITNCKGRLW